MSDAQNKELLISLISAPGVSGFERQIHPLLINLWTPWVDKIETTPLGSIHGIKFGSQAGSRPKILLAAHLDAIGLMVKGINQGFIRVTSIGGIDPRILPGQSVLIHGKQQISGIIVQPPDHLIPSGNAHDPVALEWLVIDTGLDEAEVKSIVSIGDPISFANAPVVMGEEIISGHSLDNRASIAALTICLQELSHLKHTWDVIAAATISEEETFGGAITSSYLENPTLAVVVDVTFGKSQSNSDYNTFPLGKGVALGFGPNIHPVVHQTFKELCTQLDIPYHNDVMPAHSGTDAYAVQISTNGIPVMVLGIPLRYMHTPVETVNIKDIARTGHLLAEFIARLDENFITRLTSEY